MRPVVLLISLLLATMAGYSQAPYLGQTRSFVINNFDNYYIAANTDTWLKLVRDPYIWYFTFAGSSDLCTVAAVHFSADLLPVITLSLDSSGYTKVPNDPSIPDGSKLLATYCYLGAICLLIEMDDPSYMCSCERSPRCEAFTE